MASCYFMGAKSGYKKKDNSFFGVFTFLHKDSWGQWTISKAWLPEGSTPETFSKLSSGLSVGDAVLIMRDITDALVQIDVDDSVPQLLLDD